MISVTEVHILHNRVLGKVLAYRKNDGVSQLSNLRKAREAKYNYRPYNSNAYEAVRDYFQLSDNQRTMLDDSEWYQYVLEAAHEGNWALARKFLSLVVITESNHEI